MSGDAPAGPLTEARPAIIEAFLAKTRRQIALAPASFPHVTVSGKWLATPRGDWTAGFWAGQIWLLWHLGGAEDMESALQPYLAAIAPRCTEPDADFDLGFLYGQGFALGHRLTGAPALRATALAAADRLILLAHPANGVIWHRYPERFALVGDKACSTIIDVMMNLALLWWAWRETGDARFGAVARCHTRMSAQWLVRADGSFAHLADFDPATGALIRIDTRQGAAPDSAWARGQAWGIYGFLMAAIATGEDEFAAVFHRSVEWFAAHLPEDGVPPWDFAAPPESRDVKDSSAATIVLAALARARRAGISAQGFDALEERLARGVLSLLLPREVDGMIGAGCLNYPARRGVGGATVWGDYYLLEALSGVSVV